MAGDAYNVAFWFAAFVVALVIVGLGWWFSKRDE